MLFLFFVQHVFLTKDAKMNKKYIETTKESCCQDWEIRLSDRKSSPVKTVANVEYNCWKNGTETWTQYKAGICESTFLLIQENGLFNHQW